LQKKLKCPTERLGFERPQGLIKVGRSMSALIETGVEKLVWKRISLIDLNCYQPIVTFVAIHCHEKTNREKSRKK
jgi:hypothetical protein